MDEHVSAIVTMMSLRPDFPGLDGALALLFNAAAAHLASLLGIPPPHPRSHVSGANDILRLVHANNVSPRASWAIAPGGEEIVTRVRRALLIHVTTRR